MLMKVRSNGRIDWWNVFVYVVLLVAIIFVVNDTAGIVKTPAEKRIENTITRTVIVKGTPGPRGATGARGATGHSGSRGPRGEVGPRGSTGSKGSDGRPGPSGRRGSVGPAGHSGAPGPRGPSGIPGIPGVSPSVDAVVAQICARLPIC